MDIENFPTNETAKEMMSFVTQGFYDKSYVGKWIYQVMGSELFDARNKFSELKEQIYPETATWGIMYHEKKYDLPVLENLSIEERRKRIIVKRDTKTPMTPYNMEQILHKMTGYQVSVVEGIKIPNTFLVTFKEGIECLNFIKVMEKLREIKQSHVAVSGISKEVRTESRFYHGMAHTMRNFSSVVIEENAREVTIPYYVGIGHTFAKETTIILY